MSKETLEEAAKNYAKIPQNRDVDSEERYFNPAVRKYDAFIDGAKCQQERSFSEEQVIELLEYVRANYYDNGKHWHQEPDKDYTSKELFEEFKNKFKK